MLFSSVERHSRKGGVMVDKWRLLDTGRRSAAENMALDHVLLECKARGLTPNTLRILRFKPPAVLVGYHQDVEHEVRLEYVKKAGIHVNRRITGGGAIYFDETSIGWEIIASKDSIPNYGRIEELFKTMCEGAVRALKILGVEASFRPKNDIEVRGRKISGTGGTERGGAILFQGTLLVDFDVETMVKALRIPIVKLKDKELKSAKERVTCLNWELGYTPKYDVIREAIISGFKEVFKVEFVEGGLYEVEEELYKRELPYFKSEEWIYLDRRSSREPTIVYSLSKKPGGLVRVSLALDDERNVIKSVLITGDFFIFPPRTIYDLEARLKFTPANPSEIEEVVYGFFEENKPKMPGLKPQDFVELIVECLEKASYKSKYGLNSEEINEIYFVTSRASRVLEGECDYLLLPYCAKDLECELRRREGCIKCGSCSIGEAYQLAEEAGLKPITIQNFEHLIEVLNHIKSIGGRGYVGCCCEAFYQKHRDELEEVGVPGILINIDATTCYDLGKAEEAYRGEFEVKTELKLGILKKVLSSIHSSRRLSVGTL